MRTYTNRERALFGLLGSTFALVPVVTVVVALEEPVGVPPILWAATLAALLLAAVSAKIAVAGSLWKHDPDLRELVQRKVRDRPGGAEASKSGPPAA